MTNSKLQDTLTIFETRLGSLAAIMKRGRSELFPGSDDMSPILGAKMAEDMLAFPYQIVFTCNQPSQILRGLKDEDLAPGPDGIDEMSYSELEDCIESCRANLRDAISSIPASRLDRDKTIQVPPNISFTLTGAEYVDEWLMPNFYFHFVTAYNIFRSRGLEIGKVDYMAHLMPRITR